MTDAPDDGIVVGLQRARKNFEAWLQAIDDRAPALPTAEARRLRAEYEERLREVDERLGAVPAEVLERTRARAELSDKDRALLEREIEDRLASVAAEESVSAPEPVDPIDLEKHFPDEFSRRRDASPSAASDAAAPIQAQDATDAGSTTADAPSASTAAGADARLDKRLESFEASLGAGEGATNDRPEQAEDRLDFDLYVRAFADLIESPDTSPPVTIGIFGSWGAGKSFLLWHVQAELRRRADARRERAQPSGAADRQPRTVYAVAFNAWEYNAAELIWPRLVRAILENADREARGIGRVTRSLARFGRRLRRASRGRWPSLLTVGVVSAVLASLLFQIPGAKLPHALQQVFGVGIGEQFVLPTAIGALIAFGKLLRDSFVSPLGSWMTALLDDQPAYGGQIDYMRAIKDDLEHLQRRLTKQHARVLVTIDDLDRCEPEKMIEVLQAVNLLLDRGAFVVCLGLDARIVTAAVEKHYKDLLGPAGMTGYEYLDKIIQIPFRIPEPTETQLGELLAQQLGHRASSVATDTGMPTVANQPTPSGAETTMSLAGATGPGTAAPRIASVPPVVPGQVVTPSARDTQADDAPLTFSNDELRAFQSITPYLRPNPRHIKRLVNVYALVRSLSALRGDLGRLGGAESVVRWLVLAAQWPYAVRQMLDAFDRLAGTRATGEDDPSWAPSGVAPGTAALRYLLDHAVLDPAKRDRYDDDVARLGLLVDDSRFVLWSQLRLLRRYTLNFNPALDAELRALRTEGASIDRREHPLIREEMAKTMGAAAQASNATLSVNAPTVTTPTVTQPPTPAQKPPPPPA